MCAEVTMITTSPDKAADAHALGAAHVLISIHKAAMKAAASSFDLVLDTVPVPHEVGSYLKLLTPGGELAIVGVVDMVSLHTKLMLGGGKKISGSTIGGIAATQQLLDFCAEKGIQPDCETARSPRSRCSVRRWW
jgi:alcohol dehydrogenase (NADP+)